MQTNSKQVPAQIILRPTKSAAKPNNEKILKFNFIFRETNLREAVCSPGCKTLLKSCSAQKNLSFASYVYNQYICTYNKIDMDTKLTLKLDKEIINRAKDYAESKKISLSKLIESYLQLLTNESSSKDKISPLVESLSGVIELPKKYDDKDDYTDYLTEKYK